MTTLGSIPDPPDTGGRALKVGLELFGIGTLFYALATVAEFFVSGQLSGVLEERRIEKMISSFTDHYIVCGFGRVGRQVARDLRTAGARFVVIDPNPANREAALATGAPLIESQPSDDEILKQAGIERALGVIACVDSDAENIFIALTARELRSDIFIVARASAEDSEKKMLRAGADRVISPYKTSGAEMARVALRPQVGGAFEVADYRMEEIEVSPICEGVGKTIADVGGPALIVAIRHPDGELETQPPPQTVFNAGDLIIAMGAPAAVERLERMFQPPRVHRGSARPFRVRERTASPTLRCQSSPRRLTRAAAAVRGAAGPPAVPPTLDRPRHRGQGDYSTNAAMLLAPVLSAAAA